MLATRTINDIRIRPVSLPDVDERAVLGGGMIGQLYNSTVVVARKQSGKTMLLYRLLEVCCDVRSRVVIICPTVDRDPTYTQI